jgi:hypothetical protein
MGGYTVTGGVNKFVYKRIMTKIEFRIDNNNIYGLIKNGYS